MLKLKRVNLLLILWCLSVFSTYIAIVKIYPICFVLFIIGVVVAYFENLLRMHVVIYNKVAVIVPIVLFFLLSSYWGFIHHGQFQLVDNIKMIINYLFLSFSIFFFIEKKREIGNRLNYLEILFWAIIILNVLQLVMNVKLSNYWMVPFDGSNISSMVSYRLTEYPIYFGDRNKNIWATKVIMNIIIFLFLIYLKKIKYGKITIGILSILITFFVIYSSSRTGQLSFISFLFLLTFYHILTVQKISRFFKILLIICIISGSTYVFPLLVDKVLRIDLSVVELNEKTDGLASRLLLWNMVLNEINSIGILGNGIHTAGSYISTFVGTKEDNFHNVFLNLLYETGWAGLLLFILLLVACFKVDKGIQFDSRLSLILLVPLIVILSSSYLGYDADVVIYLSNITLIKSLYLKDK